MSDKRSVHTDALETLGNIIESGERDAIHLAVEPIIAAEKLYPGQDIGIVDGKATTKTDKKLGIVDPFIKGFVPEGAMFWLVVYPRTITSLRHVWSHPAFEELSEVEQDDKVYNLKKESEKWIESYCDTIGVNYHELISRATEYLKDGNYWSEGERFEDTYLDDDFWNHYQIVTGHIVKDDEKGSFFACSC